jgi:hypothetical protein
MATEPHSLPAQRSSRKNDVIRLYRRVCLLRLRGDHAEAERLQSAEFAMALAAAKAGAEENLGDAQWQAILTHEDAQMAEAETIAELLAPLLADRLPRLAELSAESRRSSAETGSFLPPSPVSRKASSGAPAIADLIDDMLRMERPQSVSRRLS